ncbi:hypothetical protein KI688_002784 [Linnemannia hyalina]|uniref:GDP-fucose protein O-fucosyltransferase 2 n=1 Tax=Linnemannia hyalina TaxID=64524 RepID=A0A9P8BU03_9FUNG|nr:hypothetical protein KI688_002784 [Linnemannia hyalina]
MESLSGLGTKGPRRGSQRRTLLILGITILISVWTFLVTIRVRFQIDSSTPPKNTKNEHRTSHDTTKSKLRQSSSSPPALEAVLEPATYLLDPNTKYLSYLPYAGLTNQFIALEAALEAAVLLNRTIIIPPIISNSHDHDNTHQRWSHFLDLPRFTEITGVPVLEWDTVRPLNYLQLQVGKDQALLGLTRGKGAETDQWRSIAENVTCQIVRGYGDPNVGINVSAKNFAWHFLFRVTFVHPPPCKAKTPVYGRTKVAVDKGYEDDLVIMDDLVARYLNYDDEAAGHGQGPDEKLKLLFLSHTFGIKDPGHGDRFWREIGRNLYFVPQLMEYATRRVKEEMMGDKAFEEQTQEDGGVIDSTNIKARMSRIPYIAVHLRRGDIGNKCPERDMATCLIPFERYAQAVDRARVIVATTGVTSRVPVIVTTDSESEDDFRQIRELGWHRLDHEKYKTTETLGAFAPAMVDAVILAQADVLIGSGKSTMTWIAAARQRTWYQRETLYPAEKP